MSRLKEPSSAAGLGLMGMGIASFLRGLSDPRYLDFDEGEQIAQTVEQASHSVMNGDTIGGIAALLLGGFAIFKREGSK